ncbi:MAG: hypothetical protein JRI34_08865 [Deltaproteobacteria bacterium]|nr:hypothetical protein [Deltaproteobacteria bacterium]
MPKKKTVDAKKLIKSVESGLPKKEIMSQFGIKTPAQLKSLYLDALVEERKIVGIKDGRLKRQRNTNQIIVNQRGSLIIPKEMVKKMGLKVGNNLKIRKTKAGISLKKE